MIDMDPTFLNYVIAELEKLVQDLKDARQPSNLGLVAIEYLHKQFDGEQRKSPFPKGSEASKWYGLSSPPENDVYGDYSGDIATLDEDTSGNDDEPL